MHISAVAQIAAEFGVTWPNIYRALAGPVGFQNQATVRGLVFYAARSYSLMRPPRTGRRSIRFRDRSATG